MAVEKVELGFDENIPGNWFVLDNTVRGVLDSSVYKLSGGTFYDVTDYITRISTNRGKNRQLDRFNAGSFSATFRNETRIFDPTYAYSPFYGQIVPRKAIRYSVDNIVQFVGVIDDWDLSYSIDGNNVATVTAYDGFTKFANQTLSAGTATVELTGARINKILDDPKVNWGYAQRNIAAGDETLQADVISETTDVLQYINTIENTEPGMFFIDRLGNATWINRNADKATAGVPVIADDGTGIPFSGVQVVYGSELLFNQSILTRLNGATATGNDYTSQATYGVRSITQENLLHSTDSALANLAAFIVNIYNNPEFRFEQMEFALHDLPPDQRATLLNLEIGKVVKIKFTPNSLPPAIIKYAQVIGMGHEADVRGNHTMFLRFQTMESGTFLLDDEVLGLLDFNLLSY